MRWGSSLVTTLVAAAACGTSSTAYAVESIAGHSLRDRLAALDDEVAWAAWEASLTDDERERLGPHVNGISNHPPMTIDEMGINYPPIRFLPLATFHHELSGYSQDRLNAALIEIFNIQLISTQSDINLPPSATLRIELSKDGRHVHLAAAMELRGEDTYYPSHPTMLLSELNDATAELGQYPTMLFSKFEGFILNSATIEDLPPLGIPLIYNFRFGGVRVDTGFQWVGRPKGPINAGVDFLK